MADTWPLQELTCPTGLTVFPENISVVYINCSPVDTSTSQPLEALAQVPLQETDLMNTPFMQENTINGTDSMHWETSDPRGSTGRFISEVDDTSHLAPTWEPVFLLLPSEICHCGCVTVADWGLVTPGPRGAPVFIKFTDLWMVCLMVLNSTAQFRENLAKSRGWTMCLVGRQTTNKHFSSLFVLIAFLEFASSGVACKVGVGARLCGVCVYSEGTCLH